MTKTGKRPSGEWAPSLPYTHPAFRPYVAALGQLTLAWNDLHLALQMLLHRHGRWLLESVFGDLEYD
jgi:hypothetical protein